MTTPAQYATMPLGLLGRPTPVPMPDAMFATFDPRNISTLRWWVDAADITTLTFNGSLVSQWNDKSGFGRHAIQTVASSQPTYSGGTLAGRPGIIFGVGGVKVMDAAGTPPVARQPTTIFVVARKDSTANGNLLDAVAPSDDLTRQYIYGAANIEYGSNPAAINTGVAWGSSARLVTVRLNTTSSFARINGVQQPTANGGTGNALNGYRVGALTSSSAGFIGAVGEILSYGFLTDGQIRQVERYLADKWAIPSV